MTSTKKRKTKPQYELWLFRIDDWDYSYSFGTDRDKYSRKPYSEHSNLTLQCSVILPEEKADKAATLYLLFQREVDQAMQTDPHKLEPVLSIGSLGTRANNIHAFVNLPQNNTAQVIQLLHAGIYKYVQLHGYYRERNTIALQSVSFASEMEE